MEEITSLARATPSDTATRVMTWTLGGWTTRDLGADEASLRRQYHGPRKPVPCLVVDRRCKRTGDPVQQPAAPKRRRTMGPPRPTRPERPTPTAPTGRHLSAQVVPQPKRTKRMALDTAPTTTAVTATIATQPPPRPKKAPTHATTAKHEKGASAPRILAQVPPRRWKRVRPLGCGTFGCVHEVRHPDTGDRAALKEMGFLPNDYRGSRDGPLASAFRPGVSPQSAHMVFRELAAAAALRGHPSVVAVRDARLVVARTGPCAGGIECALLMDLMHGHLGRVIRTMAGRGGSSAGSLAPSSSSSSSSSSLSLSTSSAPGASLSPSPFPAAPLGSLVCLSSPTASLIDLTGASSAHMTLHTGGACPFELRVRVARLVARDILPALAFMHDRLGLAHRDIKPNNILYTGDAASDTLRFRLSDFGLARFVRRPGPETRRGGIRRRRRQAAAEPGDTNTPSPAAPLKPNHVPTSGSAAPPDPSGGPKTARTGPAVAPFTARFTANVVTHLYKPPEVLLHYGTRRAVEHGLAYGCAVDMWSFGVVLMEVLAGGHLTPSEPEETLVQRVRAVFRLDGPPRPHLVRDLVRAMAARASTGRYGIGSIPRTATADAGHDGDRAEPHADLIDLIEGLLCVDPRKRMSATAALTHPFVAAAAVAVDDHARGDPARDRDDDDNDCDDDGEVSGTDDLYTRAMGNDIQGDKYADHTDDDHGPSSAPRDDDDRWNRGDMHGGMDAPHFLPLCAYRALASGAARADERPRAGDPSVQSPTLAARRTAVTRACTFADRHDLNVYTVASAVAMFDHYLEAGGTTTPGGSNWSCGDEGVLVAMAGALFVACSLYECCWPAHDQFAALGVVPTSWYAVDQRAPSSAVRTPPFDAVLCAAVSLFDALGHLVPHPDAIVGLVDGSVALAAARGDTSPWRAVSATFSRYPPSLTLARR